MVITVEKSVKQTRHSLNIGFSSLETIPRFLYSKNILDVITDENHEKHFNIKHRNEDGTTFIKIFGNANEFCKLMHVGGHLECD